MQKCDLLIKSADVLINSSELREHVDIAVADGRILAVGENLAEQYEAAHVMAVSYTHLDVYKRQMQTCGSFRMSCTTRPKSC